MGGDCAELWYNPGSLARTEMIQRDVTIEYGALPASIVTGEFASANSLKFDRGYWTTNEGRYRVGFAYVNLYWLGFDINQAVQPLSIYTFGATDIMVRQASLFLSTALNDQLAVRATLEAVWTSVDCSYDPCVDFGSMGLGATVGLAYDVVRIVVQRIAVSELRRARATLRYIDAPSLGIGAMHDKYIPGRPQTLGKGRRSGERLRTRRRNHLG